VYEYRIQSERWSPILICVHVEILHRLPYRTWLGCIDVTRKEHSLLPSTLPQWLGYAFRHYDPSKIPERFEIPTVIPRAKVPVVHECRVA
jgi:hypothetical protein